MKKLVLLLSVALTCGVAQAAEAPKWTVELENYKNGLASATDFGLKVRQEWFIGKTLATCALSAVVTGATFITDTVPVTNFLGEGVANVANPNYQTFPNWIEWQSLASLGRGTVGGGSIAVVESLEFVVLWLGGNESQAYTQLKKTYASTVATVEALFAKESQCMMSMAKIYITVAEMQRRVDAAAAQKPQAPAEVSRP